MALTASLIFNASAPHKDQHPWGRAFSYSTTGHAILLLFMTIVAVVTHKEPVTILHEVNFIEKAAPVPQPKPRDLAKADTQAKPQARVKAPDVREASGPQVQAKAKRQWGGERKATKTVASPRGDSSGKVVAEKPLTGPIIASEPIGQIGTRKGRVMELQGSASHPKAMKGLGVPSDDPGLDPAISLDTEDLGSIRKKESSLGVPLVSEGVVGGSLSGRNKTLAQGLPQRKKASAEYLKANPLDKDKWGKSKGPFSIEGPLKYRKILKMELPPYPRWAEEQGLEASVSIRLWVNPSGKVLDNFYLEKTTGYSELDHLAMDALRRFLFVQLPDDQPQEDEWGVATFRFELRK